MTNSIMNNKAFAALSERPFLFLWIGEIFTQIPTHLFNFFLILLVFKLTHSNTAVSGIVLTFTIPAIFFGSIAGIYADRWDKKKVLAISNILRAVLMLVMIFFLDNIFMIYVISFLVTILVQFFIPAEIPMVPLVVSKKNLLSANALFGVVIFASVLIAYVLSGPTLIILKHSDTLIILAAMLLIGAGFILNINIKNKNGQIKNDEPNFLKDIKNTFSLMTNTSNVSRSLFLMAFSQILILIIATIAPGYAQQILKINIEDFPVLFATPAALGMVCGVILLVNKFHSHPKNSLITAGIFLSGFGVLFLPYGSKVASRGFIQNINFFLPHILQVNILHIMIFLAFVLGFANSFVFIPANTMLQESTDEEVRGKIYGFLNSVVGVLSLLPIVIAGGLSDLLGVGVVVTGIGFSLLIFAFIWMFAVGN